MTTQAESDPELTGRGHTTVARSRLRSALAQWSVGPNRTSNLSRALIAGAAFLVYATHSLSRVPQYLAAAEDLGLFDQAIRHYAHFQAPIASLKGPGFNLLGDHFHPILVTLAPLYWIWDDARVLLLAQAALVGASVWVVHSFVGRHLGARTAGFLAVAYALGWPLQVMIDYDFHEIAFAVPLLAVAVDALDRKSDRALLLSCAALLFVREDMGLVVLCIALLRLGRRPRWPAWLLVLVGPLTYFVSTRYFIPYFEPAGQYRFWSYTALGPDLPSAIVFATTNPSQALSMFFTPVVKTYTLLLLFVPVALLALRSRFILVAAPLLAGCFLSARANLWLAHFHYSSVVWPIIFLAAVDGAVRLRLPERRKVWFVVRAFIVGVPLAGLIISAPLYPFQRLFTGEAFDITPRMKSRSTVVAAVPPGTCVETDNWLAVPLTHTNLVFLPKTPPREPADFILVDLSQAEMDDAPASKPELVLDRARADGYRQIANRGPVILLQHPNYDGPSPGCQPN